MTEGNDDGSVSSSGSSSGGSHHGSGGSSSSGGSSNSSSSSYLVQVRAQVMMRDDSRGGWLPRGGGGLSNVAVLKRLIHHHHHHNHPSYHHHHSSSSSNNSSSTTLVANAPETAAPPLPSSSTVHTHHGRHQHQKPHQQQHPPSSHSRHHQGHGTSISPIPAPTHRTQLEGSTKEYLIYGRKISDQSVVLSCTIRKDFVYNKVMPTFHHWRTGDHKFGLTFQTAADARAFDKGVRQAVKELMDGLVHPQCTAAAPAATLQTHIIYPPAFPSSFTPAYPNYSPYFHCLAGHSSPPEEEVFVAVDLPINNEASPSAGGGSGLMVMDSSNIGGVPQLPSSSPSTSTTSQTLLHHQPHHQHHGHHSPSSTTITSTSPSHLQRINYQHRPTRPPPALPAVPTVDVSTKHAVDELIRPCLISSSNNEKIEPDKAVEQYPYVQFESELPQQQPHSGIQSVQPPPNHEYYYPSVDVKKPDNSSGKERRDSIASIKKANQQQEQLAIATTMSSDGGIGFSTGKRVGNPGSTAGIGKNRFGSIVKRGPNSRGDLNKQHFEKKNPGAAGAGLANIGGMSFKQRCRHCDDGFYPNNNPKGSCEYAPDLIRSAIDAITCIGCAQCMLYHCMSDEQEEYVSHPCACNGGCRVSAHKRRCHCCCCCSDDGDSSDVAGVNNEMMGLGGSGGSGSAMMDNSGSRCGRRWIGLTLLSMLVPCLWCYPPLRGCHTAFVACGACGGRHEPVASRHGHAGGAKYSGSKDGKYVGSSRRGSGRYSSGGGRYSSGRFDVVGGS